MVTFQEKNDYQSQIHNTSVLEIHVLYLTCKDRRREPMILALLPKDRKT